MTIGTPQRRALLLLSTSIYIAGAASVSAQEPVVLDTIVLDSASYETEGTDSYTSSLISVGEKATLAPREVPQSTSVVTRKQIEDGGYTALETALDDTPGLLTVSNDVGRSSIFSRGFEFDYLYYDGLPAPVSSIYGTQPDLSIMDHVEVLKGPSGLFIGTGEPAGSINMRLKQANKKEPGGYVTVSGDQNGHARVEADYGTALNADGTLRGRTVLAYAGGDGFVDKQTNGLKQIYGALAWDATPDTTATLSISHMQRDIAPFNGLPSYADGSLLWIDSGATTAADWNQFDNKVTDVVAGVEHRFGNGARAKFSLRKAVQSGNFLYAFGASPADSDNRISALNWLTRDFRHDNLALDLHAELPFTLGGLDGMAIVGVDAQRAESKVAQVNGRIMGNWDLDNWDVSDVARPDVAYGAPEVTKTRSTGLYTQLRVKPAQNVTLLGGARLSWHNIESASDNLKISGQVTPYAGVTWDVRPDTTIYASYTEIFQPQDARDEDGNLLKPVEGRQVELGVKAQIAGGLDVSAALFRMNKSNKAIPSLDNTYSIPEGDVRVQGFELTAAGEIGDNWYLSGGYTYTDTELSNLTPNDGDFRRMGLTPRHMFKLSAAYDVTEGAMAGWTLGGHFRAVSDTKSGPVKAPGYGVVDLSATRSIGETADLRIQVDNVLGKDYYTRVGNPTVFNFRGEPRKVSLALTKRF